MDILLAEVTQLRQQGYLIIFTFQWTEDYALEPSPAQQQDFREAVDAGAVIVSGSHAHRPQTFEFYRGSFIHYGLGNLFFDQMWSLQIRQEFIDRHVFYQGRHISTVLHTALLEDWSRPRPMTDAERRKFLETIFDASGW
jgi:poly-gamma-glutamate synthesis protein (capsule biosynthesis protein)